MQASKTHNRSFRRVFRGGQDFIDPQNCPERNKHTEYIYSIVVVAILYAYCTSKCA